LKFSCLIFIVNEGRFWQRQLKPTGEAMPLQFAASNDVHHDIDHGVLRVTINRAEKRNPLSLGVLDHLRRIFSEAAADPRVKVAVVTGAGSKAFASGGDLAELSRYRTHEEAEAISQHGRAALDAIRLFPVPVIARLNGVALGGGAELALACDLRLACSSSTFGFIHGRLRIAASWGGGRDLVRLVGPAKALQLMVSAAILDADESRATGIIDGVCPKDTAFDAWFEQHLAVFRTQPRQAMLAYKSIALSARMPPCAEAERLETEHFCEVWCHEDHWNAVAQLKGSIG
jgi:enoyl-CoA hydratase